MAGTVTPAWLQSLTDIVADHRELLSTAPVESRPYQKLCEAIGYAVFGLARGHDLGALQEGAATYADAVKYYAAAGNNEKAADAAEQAERLRFEALADIDGASLTDLRRMVEGVPDPINRARVAIRLARRAADANDSYAAMQHANSAVAALADAGFSRPGGPAHRSGHCSVGQRGH